MTANAQMRYDPWLHWFAVFAAFVTFLLLGLGGLVTSHRAGMSVTDWPNSYGYSMFFFPVSHWVGGILYEHSHRLLASLVGLLVVALIRWLGGKDALAKLAVFWLLLLVGQILLGAATIWTNKAADVATAHVLGGSLCFVTGGLWCLTALRRSRTLPEIAPAATISAISGAYGASPAIAVSK